MVQTVGIRIDPGNKKQPLHRQLFDEVVARIQSNAFPPGYKLPATRTLADELGMHRNTVARAYAELEVAGFVTSTVGRGTFVESSAVERPNGGDGPADAAQAGLEISWSALLSRAARSDALGRAERQSRRPDHKAAVINLARMQPGDELIPEALLRRCVAHVLAGHGLGALGYAPAEGTARLREQIARDLVERGVPVRAEEVIVTSGSQQGLDLVARALLDPGDTLLVEPTTYAGAIDLFTLAGARLMAVPMDAEGPDPGALERLVRPEVKGLYLMPNAHNPTGRTLGAERRRALVAWSRATGIPIIEDDYAAGIVLDESEAVPHLRALDGDVIHVSTFSKRLAPALRIGYVVAPVALRPVLMGMKRIVDLGTSAMMQHALAEFMDRGYLRAHSSRMRQMYRVQRDTLSRALTKFMPESTRWHLPSQGVVLWLRLPEGLDPERVSAEAQRQGVLVSASPLFAVGARPEPALRLIFSAEPEERLVEGVRRLGKAIKQVLSERASAPTPAPEPAEMI
ncbi:MAG TPA: PLP-dependent aminotransferase family protein [Polyangiaceae bacterium]|nr:PLP-dependent aminotransferase family protein [Polyangiaceae bacterium]